MFTSCLFSENSCHIHCTHILLFWLSCLLSNSLILQLSCWQDWLFSLAHLEPSNAGTCISERSNKKCKSGVNMFSFAVSVKLWVKWTFIYPLYLPNRWSSEICYVVLAWVYCSFLWTFQKKTEPRTPCSVCFVCCYTTPSKRNVKAGGSGSTL